MNERNSVRINPRISEYPDQIILRKDLGIAIRIVAMDEVCSPLEHPEIFFHCG